MDFEQLFDFACIFAQAGNPHIRHLMYEQFAAHAGDDNDIGATQLIDLDGIDGFRFVAARLGEAARVDPDFWDSAHLLRHLKERMPNVITDVEIAALGATDPSVQRYLDVVASTEAGRQQASQQRQNMAYQAYAQLKEQLLAQQSSLSVRSHLGLSRWYHSFDTPMSVWPDGRYMHSAYSIAGYSAT